MLVSSIMKLFLSIMPNPATHIQVDTQNIQLVNVEKNAKWP